MLACTGCQKKAEGQTVAVVNGEEITASELNAEIGKANLPADVDKKQAVARILQGLIDRRLMAEQAREEGIDRSPEFVTRQRRMNEDLLIGMLTTRQLDTNKLPAPAELAAIESKHPQVFEKRETWKLDQLQYESPKSPEVRNKILQAKTLGQLAEVLTEARIPFQRGSNQILTSSIPVDMYPQLAALSPGEPFIVPIGNRSLASAIASREASPLAGSAARTQAVNMLRQQKGTQLIQDQVKKLRSAAKVEYKDGYGPPK
jgi:EpsD family peptidyl-prolyl cis-trans isomerase